MTYAQNRLKRRLENRRAKAEGTNPPHFGEPILGVKTLAYMARIARRVIARGWRKAQQQAAAQATAAMRERRIAA